MYLDHDTNSVPTIHWAENELFPTVTVSKTSNSSITSTLKDYRPPKMLNHPEAVGNSTKTAKGTTNGSQQQEKLICTFFNLCSLFLTSFKGLDMPPPFTSVMFAPKHLQPWPFLKTTSKFMKMQTKLLLLLLTMLRLNQVVLKLNAHPVTKSYQQKKL